MENKTIEIAVLPGDGIGPEVTAEAVRLIQSVATKLDGINFTFTEQSVGAGEYVLKKGLLLLTRTIITHDSGSAGCWKTRAREKNSRPYSCTTEFTTADSRATQQIRQSILQCKPSLIIVCLSYGNLRQ